MINSNIYDILLIEGYPRRLIKEKNPQMTFEIGI